MSKEIEYRVPTIVQSPCSPKGYIIKQNMDHEAWLKQQMEKAGLSELKPSSDSTKTFIKSEAGDALEMTAKAATEEIPKEAGKVPDLVKPIVKIIEKLK